MAEMDIKKYAIVLALALGVAAGLWQCQSEQRRASGPVEREPVQEALASSAPFSFKGFVLTPRARYAIDAKILSKKRYKIGEDTDLIPWDFAMGWGPMSHEDILSKLDISQSGRFYYYHWSAEPPIDPIQIVRTSSNMHLIPADKSVERVLSQASPGEALELEGLLVDALFPNGGRLTTSLTRGDTGAGACEIMYVTGAKRRRP